LGAPPDTGAGNHALGTVDGAWWRLRLILFSHGRWVITPLVDQLLAGFAVVVGVQVVRVRAVLRKFSLRCSVGSEVGAVKLWVSASSAATGKLLARDAVIIGIQPVWIARIPLQHGLGIFLRCEVGTV
jgi:hypothetical protein